jgi:hypothetical protein
MVVVMMMFVMITFNFQRAGIIFVTKFVLLSSPNTLNCMRRIFSSPRSVCHVTIAPEDGVYNCLICKLIFHIVSFCDVVLWNFLFCSSEIYLPYHNPFNLLLIICDEGQLIILLFCNFSFSPLFITWKKILVTLFSHTVTFFWCDSLFHKHTNNE